MTSSNPKSKVLSADPMRTSPGQIRDFASKASNPHPASSLISNGLLTIANSGQTAAFKNSDSANHGEYFSRPNLAAAVMLSIAAMVSPKAASDVTAYKAFSPSVRRCPSAEEGIEGDARRDHYAR
jgi:hypothetical protein